MSARVIRPSLMALAAIAVLAPAAQTASAESGQPCDREPGWTQVAEKALPDSPGVLAVATLFDAKRRGDEPLVYDLSVRLERRQEGKVQAIASVCLPAILEQNDFIARTENYGGPGVEIDTGRYHLLEGTRAFGVRLNLHTRIPAGHMVETQQALYLFELQGKALVPVLKNLQVELSQYSGYGDCVGTGTYDRSRTLAVKDREPKNARRELVVKEVERAGIQGRPTPKEQAEGALCTGRPKTLRASSRVLRFDGQQYEVPPELQPATHESDKRPGRRN